MEVLTLKLHDFNIRFSRVIIICLIAVLISTTIVYALDSQPFTINMGVYPGAPSFTVWEQDGDYYAKNSFGVMVDSGTNFVTVVESARDAIALDDQPGWIHLSKGTFTIPVGEDRLLFWELDNLKIDGEGPATIITQADGADVTHFIDIYHSQNVEICNLHIDGNSAAQTGGTSGIHAGVSGNICTNINIHDCIVEDQYNFGIYLDNAVFSSVTNNFIGDCDNSGIEVGFSAATSGFNVISHNHIYHVAFGIGLYLANHNTISDNLINNDAAVLMNEGINLESSSNNVIDGNHIVTTGDGGIILHTQDEEGATWLNVVSNNVIENTKYSGIGLTASGAGTTYYNQVIGNTVVNCNQGDAAGYGGIDIYAVSNEVYNNNLVGNTVVDSQGGSATMYYGIHEHNGDYNLLTDNRCVGAITAQILTTGANTECHSCFNGTSWIT
jgi:parallel beta-helix repeat protein